METKSHLLNNQEQKQGANSWTPRETICQLFVIKVTYPLTEHNCAGSFRIVPCRRTNCNYKRSPCSACTVRKTLYNCSLYNKRN